jgi:hypothetical protein
MSNGSGRQRRKGHFWNWAKEVTADPGCAFFDANSVTGTSKVDGIHLDADQHGRLSGALVPVVRPMLAES